MCTPIFVERIVVTNEEKNEWKWTVQKLDDVAKTLLQCLDNKQLQYENESNDSLNTFHSVPLEHQGMQQNTHLEQQECSESQNLDAVAVNAQPRVSKEETSNPIHCREVVGKNQPKKLIKDLDIKELFLNAAKTGQWADVVGALNIDKAMFLQIIDGGGQPSFQEIFPLLISGPSVTLLIFKLTDGLETLCPVQYQPEDGIGGPKAWQDHYIVKDIISHALSSFVSQIETSTTSQNNTKHPFTCKILLVGTHKDKLEISQQSQDDTERNRKAKIESIAVQLHGWLHQSSAFQSIQVRSIEDLVTGIDNNSEQDIASVKQKIEELILQLDSQDIPAPWLVFDFVLHKYAKLHHLCKVEKSDCEKIAHICSVKDDEVDVVLHYLHFEAGTLIYYYDIPKLNQYVITDFQLIFDSVSKIIIQYFDDNSVHGPHMKSKDLFKQKGQLDESILKNVQGCLEVDELLILLRHRNIISKIEGTNMYFMPSVLPKTELFYNQSNSSFLVLFDHGYCPVGLFCAATTRLIVTYHWKIKTGELQYRNKINFYCKCSGKSYNVIFSAFSAHYEVCLIGEENLPQVKCMIYQQINDVFGKVCKDMKHPSPSYGFYCPKKCQYGSVTYLQHQHPAMCEFSYASQEMTCFYGDTPSDLTTEHKEWFPQVCITF